MDILWSEARLKSRLKSRQLDCSLNILFRLTTRKTLKFHITQPLWREHAHWWIPHHKVPVMQKECMAWGDYSDHFVGGTNKRGDGTTLQTYHYNVTVQPIFHVTFILFQTSPIPSSNASQHCLGFILTTLCVQPSRWLWQDTTMQYMFITLAAITGAINLGWGLLKLRSLISP